MNTNALQDLVSEYLDRGGSGRGRWSLATRDQYRSALERRWLPWCAGQGITGPEGITEASIGRYADQLTADGLSVHSVRTYLRVIKLFLLWAAKGSRMATVEVIAPKAPSRLLEVLTRQEIDAMEAAAVDERDRLILRTLADTGIRVGELLGLRPAALRENSHDRHYWMRVVGKGDKQRDVPLPRAVYERLRRYRGPQGAEYLFVGKRRRRGGSYEQLTRSGIDQLIHRLAREAGIQRRVYPHLFRHSYATHQLSRGVNVVTLQKVLGHESLAMISRTYSHLTIDHTYDAVVEALRG